MDIKRQKRYLDKLSHIEQRLKNTIEWLNDALLDEKSKMACYKAFQEVSECSIDICSMMMKDEGEIPKDDYTNIDTLEKKNILNKQLSVRLKELNGLRNRLIHEYNGLKDNIAKDSIEELAESVEDFIGVVKQWLKKK